MPQAFGTFENNLTLKDIVCTDCNHYFSKTLELFFARDSIEAYDRIRLGLKPSNKVFEFPQDRLTFSLAAEGEWCGLRLRLRSEGAAAVVDLVPQVGLRKKGRPEWIYLVEEELAEASSPLPDDMARKNGVKIIAPSEVVEKRLVSLLAKKGINFQKTGRIASPIKPGDIQIYINTRIDPIIKRCVAKIAFNYMTCATGRDFALLEDFNVTRSYIRFGDAPTYPIVVADDNPILANDFRTRRQTEGHLITVNWTPDKRHVVGQVSFFNRVTYRVSLARNFSGLWHDIRSGHHFDLGSRRVSRLAATSLIVPSAAALWPGRR